MVIVSIYVNIYVNVNIYVTHTLKLLLDPAGSSTLTDRLERVALIQDRKIFYFNLLKLTRRCIYSTTIYLWVVSFARSNYCLMSSFYLTYLCPPPYRRWATGSYAALTQTADPGATWLRVIRSSAPGDTPRSDAGSRSRRRREGPSQSPQAPRARGKRGDTAQPGIPSPRDPSHRPSGGDETFPDRTVVW